MVLIYAIRSKKIRISNVFCVIFGVNCLIYCVISFIFCYVGAHAMEITWIHGNFRKPFKDTNLRGYFNQFTIRFALFTYIFVDLSK